MATNPIRPALFDFLRDLAENNTREWFAENKERFEAEVREPLRAFVREFEPHLFRLSEQFVADDRKSGGSVFRIQRDTRFSHDKRPYKTNAGVHFRHAQATKEVHAPGFYLHLEPGNVFAGVGAWLPDATALRAVRTAIVEQPSVWREATQMGKYWQVSRDEVLKKAPQGFPADHELVEDLKLKSFTAFRALDEKKVCARGFVESFAADLATTRPFMKFLCEALEFDW